MTHLTRQPRPIGPQRLGIVITDAPGLFHGWQRKCSGCSCSVDTSHVPYSIDCTEARNERNISRGEW